MTRIRYKINSDGLLESTKEYLANTIYVKVTISFDNVVTIMSQANGKVVNTKKYKNHNDAVRGARKLLVSMGVNLFDEVRDGNNKLTTFEELSTN